MVDLQSQTGTTLWKVNLSWLDGRPAVTDKDSTMNGKDALVQSTGFSLKTQPRLLLLPISSDGLTTATLSSWVHLILSSNLSRKFKTLPQDSFSWHPITTTQHLSWKNCTGFPFQNVLSIKSLVCVSVLYIVQELCESRGGHPGLSVLTSLMVSVDVKNYWTVLRHWSQLVPNMSTDIWGH